MVPIHIAQLILDPLLGLVKKRLAIKVDQLVIGFTHYQRVDFLVNLGVFVAAQLPRQTRFIKSGHFVLLVDLFDQNIVRFALLLLQVETHRHIEAQVALYVLIEKIDILLVNQLVLHFAFFGQFSEHFNIFGHVLF